MFVSDGRALGLAVDDREVDAERGLDPAHQRLGHLRAARDACLRATTDHGCARRDGPSTRSASSARRLRTTPRSVSMSSSISPGSNSVHQHATVPLSRQRTEHAEHAPAGVEQRHRADGRRAVGAPTRSAQSVALFITLPMASTAPFGKPVVPLVYWICAGASGLDVGERGIGVVEELVELVEPQHRAQLGQLSGARSRACATSGLPRTSGTRSTPASA